MLVMKMLWLELNSLHDGKSSIGQLKVVFLETLKTKLIIFLTIKKNISISVKYIEVLLKNQILMRY